MEPKSLLSVFCFGCLGGLSRYGLVLLFPGQTTTLLINLIGCFLLAFLTYYIIERQLLAGWLSTGLGTGFVGAFTTFSSFCNDLDQSFIHHAFNTGILYLLISVIGGYLTALLGFKLATYLVKRKKVQ